MLQTRRSVLATCLKIFGILGLCVITSVKADNYTWNSNDVNALLVKWGVNTPTTLSFTANTTTNEVQPSKTAYFVRVYDKKPGGSAEVGSWVMPASELRGLSPDQIRDKFALPNTPVAINYVKIPGNPKYAYWRGSAGPISGWGQGGGEQIYIIGRHTNKTNPADPDRFANYLKLFQNPDGSSDATDHLFFNAQSNLSSTTLLYTPFVNTGNLGNVANYLDTLKITPNIDHSDLDTIYAVLDSIKFNDTYNLASAINNIFNPERYDTINAVGFHNEISFSDSLFDRNRARRQEMLNSFVSSNNISKISKGNDVWVQALSNYIGQDTETDHTGFSDGTKGIAGGVDLHPGKNVLLGFGATYIQNNLDWDNNGGNASIRNAKIAVYSSYFTQRFFVDAALTGGLNWTEAKRHINNIYGIVFGAAGTSLGQPISDPDLAVGDRNASSDQTGQNFGLHFKSGINFKCRNWDVIPLARLSYVSLNQSGFTETGADAANLTLKPFYTQTIRAQVGAQLARSYQADNGTLITPNIEFGMAHDFPLNRHVITFNLRDTSNAAYVEGYHQEVNSFVGNFGLISRFKSGLIVYGKYASEMSRGFRSQEIVLGAGINF